ncbi:MAG: M23 family metallopeptidase [Deltaproteobacteria bacterium]|nr:MAG: M23 family metallopeptidase [Deltaproteobacteria bacterium]TMQ21935.1 MAG: M23 family metallopeptidase [Deltaproteobacteria bacterium]
MMWLLNDDLDLARARTLHHQATRCATLRHHRHREPQERAANCGSSLGTDRGQGFQNVGAQLGYSRLSTQKPEVPNSARGWTVVIDHAPRKLATYYTHLSSLLVRAKQSVTTGTPLGIIGANPLDGERIMHLHLEVWRGGADSRFDPQRVIEIT